MSRYDRARAERPDTPPLLEVPDPGHMPTLSVRPPESIDEAFARFHADNPWVYDQLRRLALDLAAAGHQRIGIATLFEVVRWRYMRSTTDTSSTFKLNNNYRSRYARLLMENEPALAGLFNTRELTAR